MSLLSDPFQRQINYLRLSVTDHCNYHCHYCRDSEHLTQTTKNEILSYEEITRIVQIFAELGVTKVRLTGGEPLLRKNLVKLISQLKKIPGINDLPLSTNAHLLTSLAQQLKTAGINRINISIDSLKNDRFRQITRGGELDKVISGIDTAINIGLKPIKLNMVVMHGINDDEIENLIDFAINRKIDIRFIETMPIGSSGINSSTQHYSEADIFDRIQNHLPNQLIKVVADKTSGPAKNYKIQNTDSSVGIISAVSNHFCESCNRLRLTAKGRLILCLGQENSISLRDAIRSNKSNQEIKLMITEVLKFKPKRHEFDSNINNIDQVQMVEIGG